jgi:phosphoglycerate kinase
MYNNEVSQRVLHTIDAEDAALWRGKRVLVRADFNVPLTNTGEVADAFRLEKGWATIRYLAEHGARVIVLSHIGRKPEETLLPVASALLHFGKVFFTGDITGAATQAAVRAMHDGDIVLLENVRRDPRETAGEESLARELADLADFFVGDAFAAAHREHASIALVPRLVPSYAGLLVADEVRKCDAARAPEHPSLAILGGAKFETKAPLIHLLLEKYDTAFITGALANDILKARGFPTGRSLLSLEAPSAEILANPRLLAPIDVTAEDESGHAVAKDPSAVRAGDIIYDIGPETISLLAPKIASAKFILWNGPTGKYESGYTHYTRQIADLVAAAHKNGAQVVIGGGDTIAALEQGGADTKQLGFLSTGGGAMLEYLLKGTLPGIEVLKR